MGVGDRENGTAAYCVMGWGWGILKILVQLAIVSWDGDRGCGKCWYSCLLCHGMGVGDVENVGSYLLCHGMGVGDVVNAGTAAYYAMGWGWGC